MARKIKVPQHTGVPEHIANHAGFKFLLELVSDIYNQTLPATRFEESLSAVFSKHYTGTQWNWVSSIADLWCNQLECKPEIIAFKNNAPVEWFADDTRDQHRYDRRCAAFGITLEACYKYNDTLTTKFKRFLKKVLAFFKEKFYIPIRNIIG